MESESIKVGDIVRCLDESYPYFGIIKAKDQRLTDWFEVQKLSDESEKLVRCSEMRHVDFKKEHLTKLGFVEKEHNGTIFFVKDGIIISRIIYNIRYKNGFKHSDSGFCMVDNFNPWKPVTDYIKEDGAFNEELFENDTKSRLLNLNGLLHVLGISNMPIQDLKRLLGEA